MKTNSELRDFNIIMALRNDKEYCVPFVRVDSLKNTTCPIYLELGMYSIHMTFNHVQAK